VASEVGGQASVTDQAVTEEKCRERVENAAKGAGPTTGKACCTCMLLASLQHTKSTQSSGATDCYTHSALLRFQSTPTCGGPKQAAYTKGK
jgi:hypothetical protein